MGKITDITAEVKRMNLKEGDALVLEGKINQGQADALKEDLNSVGITGVSVIFLQPGMKLKHLHEKDMNKDGWFRRSWTSCRDH